jgi:hypothetical protein
MIGCNFKHSSDQVRALGILMLFVALFATSFAQAQVLFGVQTVEPSVDSNVVGQAEAFQTTATTSGTVGSLSFYVASTNKATTIYVGLYADNAGHPGTLLTQGSSSTLTKSAWNTVTVPDANVTSGTHYWIAILGTSGGKPYFRDHESGGTCTSETSKQTTLTQLPATWTSGDTYGDCPLSAYGTAAVATNPVLSVSALSISFSAAPSGAEPAPVPVNVTNTGTGTLSYTTNSDSAWLTVTPPSGSAPSTLQVSASPAGLAIGSYTGHVTVTATGAENSPAVITVYLAVVPAVDWSMVDHDTSRSGNAAEETTINNTNVGNLSWSWSASVDGPVTAQPLFVSGITISTQTQDVVVVATGGNSVYALNAATGSALWRRNFGTPVSNCSIPGGFGVTGTPLVDRTTDRIYAVSDDGMFRTISLIDGTDAAPAVTLVANPGTNKVWGGLNKIGNYVYVATGSDGCETQPWQGQVYRVNVSNDPALVNSFVVVPGIAGSDPGGGISGYGGVSSDPATGNIYAATVDDVNEAYTPYADRAIELDDTLSLLGSYDPPESCGNTPCALDFAATPLVFQPAGCSTMALVGNMNGNLYLFRATDLASGAAPLQVLTLNAANSNLGAGGLGGTPAYWAAGNMVYVTDAGPGVNEISAGVVGLSVTPSCTLQVAWSTALESSSQQVSTPTVANGVVFAGEGQTGELHAFDALTGNLLWSSSSQYAAAATYAAPTVANGHVYAGSWSNFTGGGIVGAFSLNTSAQILSVSTQTVSFSAVQAGSNPASTTVGVSNTGTGTLTFSAASDSAWLSVAPTGGSAPQNLQIAANITGLTATTYTGHISVTAAGAQESPQTITVTLIVSPPPPVLTVSTNALSFSGTQGGTNPATQPVNVSNTGGGTVTFTATSDSTWLTPNSSGGTAPQTLQVGVNLTGLTANTYTGHITVAATGVQGSPQTITVTLVVGSPAPALSVSTNALSFSGTQGGSNPTTQPVNVSNTGGGTLTFTATSDSAWLTPNSSGGTAPQTLQVGVNLSGLTANTYTGHITVAATGVQGSPQTITVTLVVHAPAPVLSVSTNALSFSGTVGGANPATQPVNVSNTGGGTLTFTSVSDSAWLTPNSSGGTAPQTLQVGVNLSGLTATTYTGHITVAATGVQGSPQTVTVTLIVSSGASTVLLGDQTVESQVDSNTNGQAEAFQTTGNVSGSLSSITFYVNSNSTATELYVGLYADNNGNPGTLLTQGSVATPTAGAWNTVSMPSTNVTAGTPYWIAVLGATSGKLFFRDHSSGSCKSQTSSQITLTSLPATWSPGTFYSDCPLSAYAVSSAPPVATKIAVTGGNNQTGNPGTKLTQALTALVTDQFGNPFSGSSVTFTDNGAGGTFGSPNPVVTGANGIASQTYTLPSANTTVTIDASASGITSPAVFTENSAVPVATKIAVSTGNNQTAAPGTKLPQSLTVLVTDQFGNPLSGSSVTFSDNSAGGTFASPNPVVTGANGIASQTYTLPASNSTVTIDATAAGIASPAVFTENSVASAATTMVITGGNNQFGTPGSQLSQSLTVLVTDQYGNPLSGESVTFSDNGAGGTFGNTNPVLTGANGVATQSYTLPASPRTITIDATAAGISTPAVFSETAGAGLAPVARDGSCSAAGTSCTFSATSPGDLKIVFAYRSASTTAPSLPSGWTNIATFATATGGATAAVTVGCEVSSSSGDTNSGTWTNASDVVGLSYSGTNVGTTANCNQTGIGQLATNSAKTSATADFPALNPMMYNSGSWAVGFLGNSAGGLCTPSGMSAVSTVGSAILANDTEAPVTSWSDESCATTSGTWVSYVLEVVPQQGFTLIQSAENASCTSGTTCAITLQQPTTAGNLNYYSCYSKEHPVMVSVDKGGTLITPTSCTSHINSTVYSCGYIDPANTSVASSPVTVTMSAAESGFGACRFWEFRPNTTGTVDLDAAFVADQPSGTAPVGPALTTSGSRPVLIENAVSGNSITAETFPYSRQQVIDAGGAAWSSAITPSTSTPPTWTVPAAISSTQGAAFSYDPTPCSSVGVIDWSGGTNGNTLSLPDVAASTHGLSTGHASGSDAWILSTSPATGMTYTTAAFKALTTPRRLCGGGTTTSGTGNLGMKYDLSTPVSKYIEYQFFSPFQAISMGFWMQTDLGNVDEQYDFANLATWPNFGAATGVHHINGNIEMECYGGTTNKTVIAAIQPNTWYWITFQLNTSGASAAVYNANGTQAGIGSCTPDGWTFSGLGDMGLGRTGSDGDNPAGMYYYFGTVVFDTEGHFPILP